MAPGPFLRAEEVEKPLEGNLARALDSAIMKDNFAAEQVE